MQDLNDTWGGAQELPVCRKLQESLRGAFMEEGVQKGLAVTVTAGIIVELHVSTVGADRNVAAQLTGLAGHNGGSGLPLYRGRAEGRGILLPCIVKDLLNLKPVHDIHLPSCQKG